MDDLITVGEASELIRSGQPLLVAGDEVLLRQLPQGQWIGGTIPYFMARKGGGVVDQSRVFVTPLGGHVKSACIRVYQDSDLESIVRDYPEHGCSFIIVPARCSASLRFARECASWPGLFNSPLVGWNAGVLNNGRLTSSPRVFDGTEATAYDNAAVVLHASLEAGYVARIEIINPFHQGDGDRITFPHSGFEVSHCAVNGVPANIVDYLEQHHADPRWPLVADYAGAQINVSIAAVDSKKRKIDLFAPVFEGVEYRLSASVGDLAEFFGNEFAARRIAPIFSCNCILNFVYAELEGKHTGDATGPMTFGEIAYVQLNQTLVYVTFDRIA
jgi:hypothetical protein